MKNLQANQPEIEPFEFQNQTVYRDIVRLSSHIQTYYSSASNDLAKNFFQDIFTILFFVSKELACLSFVQDQPMKMSVLMGCTHKVFDSFTAFDTCYESKWISAIQYFEAKQILEKIYWHLKEQRKITQSVLEASYSSQDSDRFDLNKQFQ